MGLQMSLAAPTTMTELQNDVAPAAAEQLNPKPVTEKALNLSDLLVARSAWLPSQVTEQAFQSFRKIVEANFAVAQAFCNMALRQQDFVLTTTQTTLAGLPGATAHHADITLAGIREAYRQNFRMLGTCTGAMLKTPSQSAVETQHSAAS